VTSAAMKFVGNAYRVLNARVFIASGHREFCDTENKLLNNCVLNASGEDSHIVSLFPLCVLLPVLPAVSTSLYIASKLNNNVILHVNA
jgi:hypothetical protein